MCSRANKESNAEHFRARERLKRQLYHQLLVVIGIGNGNGELLSRTIVFSYLCQSVLGVVYLHGRAALVHTQLIFQTLSLVAPSPSY
jgi:hypothetical protein